MDKAPEEEEYEAAMAAGGMDVVRSIEEEARELVQLAFGIMILLAIVIVGLVAAYALTGWGILLILNLFFCSLAIVAFVYLSVRRSKLTMRL